MKTKILRQIGLACVAALAFNACAEDAYQRIEEDPLKRLQVKVTGITAPDVWGEGETSTLRSDSLDLEGMPAQRANIGDEWAIATHVVGNGVHAAPETEGGITRGVLVHTAMKLPSMGISIYNGKTLGFTGTTPVWKRVQAVNTNADGNWSIPGEGVTWPVDTDKLTFLAFSPYSSQANGLTWAADGRTLDYVVPVEVAKQPDLCMATPVKDRPNIDGSGNHVVPFAFNHALTAVTLKASAHQIKIISATIKNVKTKGTIALETAAWSSVGVTGNRALGVNERVESLPIIDITKTDGHLMMIPQTLDDAAILEFVFDDLSKIPVQRITKTVRLNTITPDKKWMAGKQVLYNLQLKVEYNLTVNPTLINLSYEKGSYTTGITYATNNPKAPTVTANQGWISNIKVVAGKITFDYTENSSKAERTAIISVTSGLTTKTITVKQAVRKVVLVESNCYILVPSGESVEIPVKRANADKIRIGNGDIITAELLWQDTPGAVGSSASCIASLKAVGVGKAGTLEVKPGATSGNALVAVKVNGKVQWSWHIWVTTYDPAKVFKTYNGKKWLDRNIGATTNVQGDINTVGMYYQWGRKDPFVSSGGFNSSTTRKLYNATGGTIDYTFKTAYHLSDNFENALQNPMHYFYARGNTPPYQWSGTSIIREDLWSPSTKKEYDPCPLGWRVPGKDNFGTSLAVSSATSGFTHTALGYFPLGGNRSCWNGGIEGSGSSGACWTSNIKKETGYVDGHYLTYRSTSASISAYSQCMGMSIRCIQE